MFNLSVLNARISNDVSYIFDLFKRLTIPKSSADVCLLFLYISGNLNRVSRIRSVIKSAAISISITVGRDLEVMIRDVVDIVVFYNSRVFGLLIFRPISRIGHGEHDHVSQTRPDQLQFKAPSVEYWPSSNLFS